MSPYLNKKYLNPSYEDVCQGNTSLIEVYNFNFHGNNEIYEKLCWFFFSFHDPTTINRQGSYSLSLLISFSIFLTLFIMIIIGFDIGTQYASVIFYYDDTQRDIAINVKEKLQHILNTQKNVIRYSNKEIVTEIKQATTFYPAPEYHQQYLTKNPGGYCNHFYRFDSTQFHK